MTGCPYENVGYLLAATGVGYSLASFMNRYELNNDKITFFMGGSALTLISVSAATHYFKNNKKID